MNSKPCYAFDSDPKTFKPFLNDANLLYLCSKYFFKQIIQIYLDLFAKNMKGWSDNSEFGVLSNEVVLRKLENQIFSWAALLGANIFQIFSPAFSISENIWSLASGF